MVVGHREKVSGEKMKYMNAFAWAAGNITIVFARNPCPEGRTSISTGYLIVSWNSCVRTWLHADQ
jgi:hypothetical protein